jgi:hypothetical protein
MRMLQIQSGGWGDVAEETPPLLIVMRMLFEDVEGKSCGEERAKGTVDCGLRILVRDELRRGKSKKGHTYVLLLSLLPPD